MDSERARDCYNNPAHQAWVQAAEGDRRDSREIYTVLTELKGLLCIANFDITEEENIIPLVYTYVIVSFVSLFELYFIFGLFFYILLSSFRFRLCLGHHAKAKFSENFPNCRKSPH